jgi:hypothetical protein
MFRQQRSLNRLGADAALDRHHCAKLDDGPSNRNASHHYIDDIDGAKSTRLDTTVPCHRAELRMVGPVTSDTLVSRRACTSRPSASDAALSSGIDG